MKKLTLIALGVSAALGLSACNPAPKTDTASTQAEKKPLQSGIDVTAIDTAVAPGEDFFRYVNGSWLSKTEIPADKSRYSVFNILYDNSQVQLKEIIQDAAAEENADGSNNQKLGDMYNSYMNDKLANELGVKPVQPLLDEVAAISNASEFAAEMGKLGRLGVDAPFGYYVSPDAKEPGVYAAYYVQSGLTMPDKDYYFKDEEKFQKFRAAMLEYVEGVLTAAGYDNAKQAADNIMALETAIADKHLSRVERRDAEKNYNKRSTEEVTTLLNGFDYAAYAKGSGIEDVQKVIVRELPYFEAIGGILADTDLQTLKDYLAFRVVDQYAPRLSDTFSDLSFNFYSKTLRGVPEQQERWKRAVASTSGVLGEVLGQQYVKRHFKPEAKAKMESLVDNLVKAYGQSIKEIDWMTDTTKQAALEKLSKFTPKIGYPDKWRDYSALTIKADDLVGNYQRYYEFETDFNNKRIGQEVDTSEWGMTPQTINAYYSPTRNEIVFPAAILQPPFFNMDADDAVNYGAIGAVIGHEIGHGFDDQGSKYDGDGNLRSWWTDEDRTAFEKLTAKLVDQYNQFEPIEGQHVNGELTLGENIGDLSGVTIGHKAYVMSLQGKDSPVIDGLTGDQRFLMGYAQVWRGKYRDDALRAQLLSDPHSPGEFRTNGIVRNSDVFYKAFDIKEGDEMYLKPEDRVKIW
ncbi:M13 family metallopeptidase [Neptunicella marina]|uniref:Peptidase M13 n=1 Tax=Neptunicella marina TaxID=2125989 RepID=A0A8J6ITH9_9ALTE|nr:M13-type metalloendopeptidase [Neptunicella marina]MBC3765326.1 peptidase M13 [Neptunicella marina]